MTVPWHITKWNYNFKGSIGSRKTNRRCVTVLKVYFVLLSIAGFIAWAIVEDKIAKAIILFITGISFFTIFFPLAVYLVYCSYLFAYWCFYRFFHKQRKAMDVNYNDLENTLLAFHQKIPSIEELELIERINLEYLHNTKKQIDEIMQIDTQVILTGSSEERYSVPFTNAQEISKRHDCIPRVTFFCVEHLQRQDLKGLTNFRHALLSDCDCMISPKNDMVSFSEERSQKYQALVKVFPYYIIKNGNEELHSKKLKKNLLEMAEKIDVNSIPWRLSGKGERANNFVDLNINGPALTLKLGTAEQCQSTNMHFYGDITYSLKCPEWPTICDWGRRANTKWPKHEEIEEIKSFGCHFVPKSHPEDLEGSTWRISFSKAEVELSKLVPHAARMCLVGLKVISKDYLSVVCKKLKSYHLKCIFLHTLETTDPSIWREDNLLFCFEYLLTSLRTCIEHKTAPYFWLPANNLFENFTNKDFQNLLRQLERVERNPSEFMEPLFLDKRTDEIEEIV